MFNFVDKVAVVTGGASGIGYSITDELVKNGAKVVVGDLNTDKLEALSKAFGDDVVTIRADVTVEDDMKALADTAVNELGRLDAAFNVAGLSKAGLIMEQNYKDWRTTVDIVLDGVFLAMKHQGNAMKDHGGAIVNISSLNPMCQCSMVQHMLLRRRGLRC